MTVCRNELIDSGADLVSRSCLICGLGPCSKNKKGVPSTNAGRIDRIERIERMQDEILRRVGFLVDRVAEIGGRLDRVQYREVPIGPVPVNSLYEVTAYAQNTNKGKGWANIGLGSCNTCANENAQDIAQCTDCVLPDNAIFRSHWKAKV